MALFSQNMAELATEIAVHDRTYEDMVSKFAEHFLYIAAAMNRPGRNGAGLGVSHQTGWTGLIAKVIQLYGLLDPSRHLEAGKLARLVPGAHEHGPGTHPLDGHI